MLALGKGNVKCNSKTINVTTSYNKTNISTTKTKIVLSLHYNKQNSCIFANGDKITDFRAKDSEINNDPICLGNISKDFSERDTKKNRAVWICVLLQRRLQTNFCWQYTKNSQIFNKRILIK